MIKCNIGTCTVIGANYVKCGNVRHQILQKLNEKWILEKKIIIFLDVQVINAFGLYLLLLLYSRALQFSLTHFSNLKTRYYR